MMEVLTPAAVSVCVAPATAEPDARVVMDWLAKPLLPLKPNVPTPPLEILDTVIEGTVGAAHTPGSEIALALVVTVPPDVKARPDKVAPAPMDIPAFPMTVPMKVELAPSVVAAVGAQNTLPAQAPPLRETMESAAVLSAAVVGPPAGGEPARRARRGAAGNDRQPVGVRWPRG